MSPRNRAYVLLIVAVAIWGIAGPIIKFTLAYFDPVIFLTYRFFITSCVLIPLVILIHPKIFHTLSQLSPKDWTIHLLSGLFATTFQLGLLFWGFSLTTSLDGSLLSSTAPILVSIAGAIFLHEHITRRKKIGLIIAFLGSLTIMLQPLVETGKLLSGNLIGNTLILIGNIFWVASIILTKKLLRDHVSPLFLTTIMFAVGFISFFVILLLTHSPSSIIATFAHAPVIAHVGVLYMAILSGALAYFFYHFAQRTISATEANLFSYLQPLFSIPLSFFWLGEPLTITFIVGSCIIAGGIIFAETRNHIT